LTISSVHTLPTALLANGILQIHQLMNYNDELQPVYPAKKLG